MFRRPKSSKYRRNSARHHRSHNRKLSIKKKAVIGYERNGKKHINVNKIEKQEDEVDIDTNDIEDIYKDEGKVESHYEEPTQMEGDIVSYVYNDVDEDKCVEKKNITLMGFKNEDTNNENASVTLMGLCESTKNDENKNDDDFDSTRSKSKVVTLMGFATK